MPLRGPGVEVVGLLGSQGFWQHRVLRGVGSSGSRKYGALGPHGNQYRPIRCSSLAWRSPLTQKPGRPQSRGLQRAGQAEVAPRAWTQDFRPCSSAPVRVEREAGTAAGSRGSQQRQVGTQTASAAGVMALSVLSRASCSWPSEGLFGQSFSTALPVQALRVLPCLGSFSVVQHFKHTEGAPGWGPTL